MSFQMFCRQIYQIHDSKYETDDSHDCKYLPIFISFTIDNPVDTCRGHFGNGDRTPPKYAIFGGVPFFEKKILSVVRLQFDVRWIDEC